MPTDITKAEVKVLGPCHPFARLIDKAPKDPMTAQEIINFLTGENVLGAVPWLMSGSVKLATAFITEAGQSANVLGLRSRTALHLAAYYRRAAVITYLLSQGANKTLQDDEGLTPVVIAILTNDPATIAAMGV